MTQTIEQLTARVRELEKERDAAREEVEGAAVLNGKMFDSLIAKDKQIAALELEVVRLRTALETFIAEHEECEDGDGWMAQMCSMEALHVADEAMSTPFTPTALQADSATAWAQAHRLALELECLLLDTKDNAIVSKWWDSGMAALNEYQQLKPGAKEDAEAWAKMRKEML